MFIYIIIFILILSFLVLAHEFGHFITAKKSGMDVEEFGFGYPPTLFSKKIGSTVYSINWIPFGGFVKIRGEDDYNNLRDPSNFNAQPIGKRALVLVAGVLMNFLVAIVIFYYLLFASHFQVYQTLIFDYKFPFGQQHNFPAISYVLPNSPAAKSGLKAKDVILEANGSKVDSAQAFVGLIRKSKSKEINLVVKDISTKKIKEVNLQPRVLSSFNNGKPSIGISLSDVAQIKYSNFFQKLLAGFLHAFNILAYSIVGLWDIIKISVITHSSGVLSQSIVGPIGVLALTKIAVTMGLKTVLNLTAIISLALAFTNILPLPALDGGKLAFLSYEYIIKRRPSPNFQRQVETVGFFLLVALAFLITFKDFFQFKGILFH